MAQDVFGESPEQYEYDEADRVMPSDQGLGALRDLVQVSDSHAERIRELEDELEREKRRKQRIDEERIPAVMLDLGLEKLTLSDGRTLEIETVYYGSIPKATQEQAFAHLERIGEGAIVKRNVTVQFGRNQSDEADALREQLAEQGLSAIQTGKVESSTLRALVRRLAEKGTVLPQDVFSTGERRRAKFKNPRRK